MPSDNTRHLIEAAAKRSDEARARATHALAQLRHEGTSVSISAFARSAGVSRSWLYKQPDILNGLQSVGNRADRAADAPAAHASDASLRRRLELAHQRIRKLVEENKRLRDQVERALGVRRSHDALR